MNRPSTVKATYPTKDFTTITQVGLKAHNLATTHKDEIEARLPGTTDALGADLDTLGAVVPAAIQARHEAHAATTTQNTLIKQGYSRVRAIRQTVRKAGAPKDVQRAYGVGQDTSPIVAKDVKAALQQIIDRATTMPDEAAVFGLIPAAITALQGFHTALSDADMTQDRKRAHAPLSTKERNLTANRILQAAVLIAGAGMLAFMDDPTTFASFEALMASTRKTAASKTKKQPDAPGPQPPPSPPSLPSLPTELQHPSA